MKQTTIPIKTDSRIMVKCSDDLSVEGSEGSTLVVTVEQGDGLHMKEENGLYRIVANSDCRVMVPIGAMVTVEKTGGDAHLKNLQGRVVVGKVSGDLRMESIGGASVESVGGDCSIHNASGAIELVRVGGALTGDGLQSILASAVGDDVRLTNPHARVDVAAGDEISIQVSDQAVPEIKARAGSDIRLFLPVEANAQLHAVSGGEEIVVHAGGQDAELEEREFSIQLGEGGSMISLTAGDSIHVTDQEKSDWEDHFQWDDDHWKDFGQDIARKVNEGLKAAEDSMNLAFITVEKAGKHASKQVQKALHEFEVHGFNSGRRGKVVGFSSESEQGVNPTPKAGPSDEERMLVLKMLQEKKITVEEAEKLLNALDR